MKGSLNPPMSQPLDSNSSSIVVLVILVQSGKWKQVVR